MTDASDGARIKVWPGIDSDFQPGLSGGGGSGLVKNITYRDFRNKNNDCKFIIAGISSVQESRVLSQDQILLS